MTRSQFTDSLTRLRTSQSYQGMTEPEQQGMVQSVLETEFPGLLTELDTEALALFKTRFPQYAEMLAPYGSLQQAYDDQHGRTFRDALNQWSVERHLAQHTELCNGPELDTDGTELAPAGPYHGMSWQEVFELHPELAYKLPPTRHLLVESIRWWANPNSGEGDPVALLDQWWQEQFNKTYFWEDTNA